MSDDATGTPQREPLQPGHLIELLEIFLLGEEPTLSGQEIAAELGIRYETAQLRWRSLGFSEVPPDVPAFTQADVRALHLTQKLSDYGLVDPANEAALVRALGRSYSRLAEWQMGLLARTIDLQTMDLDEISTIMTEVTPAIEALQNYVWRRHTLAAASRLLLANRGESGGADGPEGDEETQEGTQKGGWSEAEGSDATRSAGRTPLTPGTSLDLAVRLPTETGGQEDEGVVMGVGFADIVGYTRQSRQATRSEIARMIDVFEERSLEILTSHEGRIVKTIGDEILFVADTPANLARIGLELSEARLFDEEFPELRVGLAWGPVLPRLGDVFGPVVNIASRLTATARPGRVLCDRGLADELADDEHFRLRRLRRTSVKGYRRLEPWSLRRPAGEDPEISEDGVLPGPVSSLIQQQAQELKRVVEQIDVLRPRLSGGEDAD